MTTVTICELGETKCAMMRQSLTCQTKPQRLRTSWCRSQIAADNRNWDALVVTLFRLLTVFSTLLGSKKQMLTPGKNGSCRAINRSRMDAVGTRQNNLTEQQKNHHE